MPDSKEFLKHRCDAQSDTELHAHPLRQSDGQLRRTAYAAQHGSPQSMSGSRVPVGPLATASAHVGVWQKPPSAPPAVTAAASAFLKTHTPLRQSAPT